MAQRRTSPRRSGGSESAVKNSSTSPGPTLKKAKNERGSIFNCLMFIEVLRELSKHTTYVPQHLLFMLLSCLKFLGEKPIFQSPIYICVALIFVL
jgi:hypothetical protein